VSDIYGCADTTNTISFVVSTNEFASRTGISVYPNPFHDQIRISFPEDAEGYSIITIYDLSGKTVYNEVIENKIFNIRIDLNPGFYFVNVQNSGTSVKKVIIKQ
jgi:hypothetical protein